MKRGGGRLTVSGLMSQSGRVDPLEGTTPLTKEEQQIKALKKENQKLKADLNDIRSMYKQLVSETSHERFDERRVTLLKSQIIQLERQLLLLTEAMTSRGDVLLEVENNLQWLADRCRSYICQETRGPQVHVVRSDLTLMVETAESARIKLYKQLENNSTLNLAKPLRFYSNFLQTGSCGDITLFDVAAGKLDHINLTHVTQLESKLSSLYRDLIQVNAMLSDDTGRQSAQLWTSGHVTGDTRDRLSTQLLTACARMQDCTSDLLELSLLYPSAPWPPLKRCALETITAERVLASLPGQRSRSQDTVKVIEALVKAYNYKVHMLNKQNEHLKSEIEYHKKVYNHQLKYTESLFQTVREAYTAFEEMTNKLLVKPLQEVLQSYVDLSQSASESSLKKFVSVFKDNVPQLNEIVETCAVKTDGQSNGDAVLSDYGEQFFSGLEALVRTEQARRDTAVEGMHDVQAEHDKLTRRLQRLLGAQECKPGHTGREDEQDWREQSETEPLGNNSPITQDSYSAEMSRKSVEKPLSMLVSNKINEGDRTLRSPGEGTEVKNRVFSFMSENNDYRDNTNIIISQGSECEDVNTHRQDSRPIRKAKGNKMRLSERPPFVLGDENENGSFTSNVDDMSEDLLARHADQSDFSQPSNERGKSKQRKSTNNIKDFSSRPPFILGNEKESDDSCNTEEMTDEDFLAFNTKHIQLEVQSSRGLPSMAKPPAPRHGTKSQSKKKLNYVPNTFVPNRTLQLRRAGSLPSMNSPDTGDVKSDNITAPSRKETLEAVEEPVSGFRQSSTKLKHFKTRPAFR